MGNQCSCTVDKLHDSANEITHNDSNSNDDIQNVNHDRLNSRGSAGIAKAGIGQDTKAKDQGCIQKKSNDKPQEQIDDKSTKQTHPQQHHSHQSELAQIPNCKGQPRTGRKPQKFVQLLLPAAQPPQPTTLSYSLQRHFTKAQQKSILQCLKTHFILSQLNNQELEYLVKKMKYATIERDQYVFKQGDSSYGYYVIVEGKCRVEIDQEAKRVLGPGLGFGDLGIVYSAPRSASIFAETQCLLAELNAKAFRKIINDLNSIYERQNKQILSKFDFFKDLTQPQKNSLASNCITQIYQSGQIIFRKGDAANTFYLIQQGIITILQKNIDLKSGDNVGINAILSSSNQLLKRSNTLIAKTSCKLLSLTRQIIRNNLGDNVGNVIRKNVVMKILKQSLIWDMYATAGDGEGRDKDGEAEWREIVDKLEVKLWAKGEIVFAAGMKIQPLNLYILLKNQARSKKNPRSIFYPANSIIEQNKVYKKQQYVFDDDYQLIGEGEVVKIILPKQQKPKAIQTKKSQTKSNSNPKPLLTSTSAITNSMTVSHTISNTSQIHSNPSQTMNVVNIEMVSSNIESCLNLDDFIILRRLRSGNFGKVYACYNRKTRGKYAIKVMNKGCLSGANITNYLLGEGELLEIIPPHPFLVRFNQIMEESGLIILILQLIQGQDLFDCTNNHLPLKYIDYKLILSQLILIIEHLHTHKIVYRDLKPQNIMLNTDGYIKLVDLGTAKKLTIENRFRTMTIIGTPHYMAPQIVLGKGYGFGVDWWSLGVLMYELVCAKLPFGEVLDDPFGVYEEVLRNQLKFVGHVNRSAQEIIGKLLTKNSTKRLSNGSNELKQLDLLKDVEWDKIINKQYQTRLFPSKNARISQDQIDRVLNKKRTSTALQLFLKDRDIKF